MDWTLITQIDHVSLERRHSADWASAQNLMFIFWGVILDQDAILFGTWLWKYSWNAITRLSEEDVWNMISWWEKVFIFKMSLAITESNLH